MFESAELAIFRDVRLDPVFFGTSLAGDNLPNLTYMLGYRDMQEREKNWKAFLSHPSWQTLKANPRYADTVSKIISVFLKPRDYSQV